MKPYLDGIITFKFSRHANEAYRKFQGETYSLRVDTIDGLSAQIEMSDFRETPEPSDITYENLG